MSKIVLNTYPGGQAQLKSLIKSVQLAPSKHGFSAQSSTLISQCCPLHPVFNIKLDDDIHKYCCEECTMSLLNIKRLSITW